MGNTHFEICQNRQKAVWRAMWLNFEHRVEGIKFSVLPFLKGTWRVVKIDDALEIGIELDELSGSLSEFSYDDIRAIKSDEDPIRHFEEICGTFSNIDGEYLRYILHANIPIEKLIRYELAIRGYDENHQWCGFEKAQKIWLENK